MWYKNRPDILDYMQKAYKDLNIQFLPNKLVENFNQQKLETQLFSTHDSLMASSNHLSDYLSTEILSKDPLLNRDLFLVNLNSLSENLQTFVLPHTDKLS